MGDINCLKNLGKQKNCLKVDKIHQMKYEYEQVWVCDYCGKEFKTKKKCDQHELECPKKDNQKFSISINRKKIFNSVLGLLIAYLLLFGLANSYAESNNLIAKNLFKPSTWFRQENGTVEGDIAPTPTSSYNVTPTPTIKPKVTNAPNQKTNDPSVGSVECIGPDGKHFFTTMEECTNLNQKWGKPVNYMVNCTYPSECGGGVKRISKKECDKPCTRINSNSNSNKNNDGNYTHPTYAPIPTYKPYATYSPIPTSSHQVYVTPTLTDSQTQSVIDQYNHEVLECRGDVIHYYEPLIRGCNIKFGDSSATEACERIYEDQRQRDYDACGETY